MLHKKWLARLCLASAITAFSPLHATDVSNTTYVAQLEHTPLFLAMNQPAVEALYMGMDGAAMPYTPLPTNVGVGPGILGAALGMAIISATEKAKGHEYAETHIARLREASRSLGLEKDLQGAILESLGDITWLNGGSVNVVVDDKDISPSSDSHAWLVLHARYALSTDFSHVVVVTEAQLFKQSPGDTSDRWRRKPAFHNVLVFQSEALQVPAKTPADTERMIAEENARWDQNAINAEIDQINKEGQHDSMAGKRRRAVLAKMDQHKKNLAEARSTEWNRNQLGYEYARLWGDHDAAALRQALHDGGLEVGKMLTLTFSGQHDNVGQSPADSTSQVSSETPRRMDYLQPDGNVMSVMGSDRPMIGPYFTGT